MDERWRRGACAPFSTISTRSTTLFRVLPEERSRTSARMHAAEAHAMSGDC